MDGDEGDAQQNNGYDRNHERRISALENGSDSILRGIEDIKAYLVRSADKREEMMKTLTTVAVQQTASVKYQAECDAERRDHASRLNSVENYQTNQKRNAAGVAALVTIAVTGGGKAIEKIGAWLTS